METSLIDLFLVYTEGVTIAQVNEHAKENACYKGQGILFSRYFINKNNNTLCISI